MMWSSFHALICHSFIFFGEVSIQIFCPFFTGLFIFLYWVLTFFLYSGTSLLSDMQIHVLHKHFRSAFDNLESFSPPRNKFNLQFFTNKDKWLTSKQKGNHWVLSESVFHIYRLLKRGQHFLFSYTPSLKEKEKNGHWVLLSNWFQTCSSPQPLWTGQLGRKRSKRGCGERPIRRGNGRALLPCKKYSVENKTKGPRIT